MTSVSLRCYGFQGLAATCMYGNLTRNPEIGSLWDSQPTCTAVDEIFSAFSLAKVFAEYVPLFWVLFLFISNQYNKYQVVIHDASDIIECVMISVDHHAAHSVDDASSSRCFGPNRLVRHSVLFKHRLSEIFGGKFCHILEGYRGHMTRGSSHQAVVPVHSMHAQYYLDCIEASINKVGCMGTIATDLGLKTEHQQYSFCFTRITKAFEARALRVPFADDNTPGAVQKLVKLWKHFFPPSPDEATEFQATRGLPSAYRIFITMSKNVEPTNVARTVSLMEDFRSQLARFHAQMIVLESRDPNFVVDEHRYKDAPKELEAIRAHQHQKQGQLQISYKNKIAAIEMRSETLIAVQMLQEMKEYLANPAYKHLIGTTVMYVPMDDGVDTASSHSLCRLCQRPLWNSAPDPLSGRCMDDESQEERAIREALPLEEMGIQLDSYEQQRMDYEAKIRQLEAEITGEEQARRKILDEIGRNYESALSRKMAADQLPGAPLQK